MGRNMTLMNQGQESILTQTSFSDFDTQKQCLSAPPGVRTLDTLIKRDLVIQNKVNFP